MSSKKDKIVYKPLGLVPEAIEEDEEIDDVGAEEQLTSEYCDLDDANLFKRPFIYKKLDPSSGKYGLRQLRLCLYITAFALFLIFMAQLCTNDQGSAHKLKTPAPGEPVKAALHEKSHRIEGRELTSESELYQVSLVTKATKATTEPSGNINTSSPKQESYQVDVSSQSSARPKYDSYLSSVLNARNYNSDGRLLDDLSSRPNFGYASNLPSSSVANHQDQWWTFGTRDSQKYVTITNYVRAMKSFNFNSTITLSTQATTEFMYHIIELCKRWDGPISTAIFSPGPELQIAMTLIKYMRNCLAAPLSACIQDKVTWHLVLSSKIDSATLSSLGRPSRYVDEQNYPLFAKQNKCPKLLGPEAEDSIKQLEVDLRKAHRIYPSNYRKLHELPYPINVLRNTAREAAESQFVLASDVELYPSINLVPMFEKLMRKENITEKYNLQKFVFTLPIFEVKSNVKAPKTKEELRRLFISSEAIFFHKWVCDACQNFPYRNEWIYRDVVAGNAVSDIPDANEELRIFDVTRRDKSRDSWEPIFIGTNEDPPYDDRLTWDGRRDKMVQMYELCLMDYKLLVLGNAFLVHAPGIKHIDREDVLKRRNYITANNAIYDYTILELRQKYANSTNINKC